VSSGKIVARFFFLLILRGIRNWQAPCLYYSAEVRGGPLFDGS
jgi:hypothetical protein